MYERQIDFSNEEGCQELYNEIANPVLIYNTEQEFIEAIKTVKNTVSLKTYTRLVKQCTEAEWYLACKYLEVQRELMLNLSKIVENYNNIFFNLDVTVHQQLLNNDRTIQGLHKAITIQTKIFKSLFESESL